jgi:hypothetical protein
MCNCNMLLCCLLSTILIIVKFIYGPVSVYAVKFFDGERVPLPGQFWKHWHSLPILLFV